MNFKYLFILLALSTRIALSQEGSKKFETHIVSSNNEIVNISNESIQKLIDLGFEFSPHYDYLGRNFSEHFDFNNDGFKDIVWAVPKNPSIGSPLMLLFWDQEQRKYVEQTSYFILGHGDHMMYYDTVDDFDRDGDLDIFLPIENYHGEWGRQPNYYFPEGNFVPGNMLFNDSEKLTRVYIDTTTIDHGDRKDYLPFWQAALIEYDEDDKMDLIVSSVNVRPDAQGYLATRYTVSPEQEISREFVFPWESDERYQGQSHSLQFKNYNDKIYVFMQSREDIFPIEERATKGFSYTHPEIRIYDKSKGLGLSPTEIKRFDLKRNLDLIDQSSIMYHDTYYVEDLDKDGNEEIIIGMFTVPMNDKHSSIHVFDNQGNEISDEWFQNLEFIETTRAHGNGFDMIDLNGDGYKDILFRDRFNSSDSDISFFLNTGSSFERHILNTNGPGGFNIAVDSDKDGKYEILKVRNHEPDPNKVVTQYVISYSVIDKDSDGVLDELDNCPDTYNPDQMDEDGDGIGDVCDKNAVLVEPLTVFENDRIKIHLIENPFHPITGFVAFGSPFTSDVIPIDINRDGNIDIINGTIELNEDDKRIELGHVTLPIYMEHLGDFKFSIYMNPNYKDYSLLHAIQDYEIADLNQDGYVELILGGEHVHVMNVGEEQFSITNEWLKENASYEITQMTWGDYISESKYNRYYELQNGYLIDKVKDFGNNGVYSFNEERRVSNGSQGVFDLNNDGLYDVIYNVQGFNGYSFDTYINKGNGEFDFKRNMTEFHFPNGKLIPFDANGDGYNGFLGAGMRDYKWYLLQYLNVGGSIDYSSPLIIEEIKPEIPDYPNSNQSTLRNFHVTDLNDDGVNELIVYYTNQYSDLSQYSDNPDLMMTIKPNLISVYELGQTVTNVTYKYFDSSPDLESFNTWYGVHSNLIFKDIDLDGQIDLVPYRTRHYPKSLWNESEEFIFFSFDKESQKFIVKKTPGFRDQILNSNISSTDIFIHNDSYQFDYIDLNKDGVYELIESSVNYGGKNYMMIIEGSLANLDLDNDGVSNLKDQCPNTKEGVLVDTNGCEIFTLSNDVFSVNAINSTCVDSDNGSIRLSSTDTNYNYLYSIDGSDPTPVEGEVSVNGLGVGSYNVCFTVDGVDNYERCYTVSVGEPDPLEVSSLVSFNDRSLNLNLRGSKTYQVLLNGKELTTDESRISLSLQSGKNTIEVKGEQDCQGIYFEEIFVSEEVKVYPNPTNGPLQLYISGMDSSVEVSITSINGAVVQTTNRNVPMNRVLDLDLTILNSGTYIVSIKGPTVQVHQKVIKR